MKNLKIIYSALLIGLVLFGGVFVFFTSPNGSFSGDSSGIILGITVFLLPISWYIPLFFAKRK